MIDNGVFLSQRGERVPPVAPTRIEANVHDKWRQRYTMIMGVDRGRFVFLYRGRDLDEQWV